jgi:glycosyltransferase involved in cell wall biosynthesis
MSSINDKSALVSVIMPTYNHARYIGEAIESVQNQTYKNFELIIIDNYSTDNTAEIVASYNDKRIKYLKFKNHGIIAASRNHGIKNSNGKYIAFLDSDDIWLPQKLDLQIELMESNKDIGMSYVLYSHLLEDGSVKGVFPKLGHRLRGDVFTSLYRKSVIANSGTVVRTQVFKELGLLDENPKLVTIEDYEMWLRIAKSRPIDYVDHKTQLLYRIRCDNSSNMMKLFTKWQREMLLTNKYAHTVGKLYYVCVVCSKTIHLIYDSIIPIGNQPDLF